MIGASHEKINEGYVVYYRITVYTRDNMPRALTAVIVQKALVDNADLKSNVTDETTWDDISIEAAGFKTPMDFVTRHGMKKANYGDVLKRIVRDMCIKAYEQGGIVSHEAIGITKRAKDQEDKMIYVTRLQSIMMHLYKIHLDNDAFLKKFAQVPKTDSKKPTSSGWYCIMRDHKVEINAKVERLNEKNESAAQKAAQMDNLVKKAENLKLNK